MRIHILLSLSYIILCTNYLHAAESKDAKQQLIKLVLVDGDEYKVAKILTEQKIKTNFNVRANPLQTSQNRCHIIRTWRRTSTSISKKSVA